MQLLRRLTAIALLALWLPATAHCSFEAAGFDELFGCADGHHDSSGADSPDDGCDDVETGRFRTTSGDITLPPPALTAVLFSLCVVAPPSAPLPSAHALTEATGAPPELARTWHFVVRAVPAPRAPANVS